MKKSLYRAILFLAFGLFCTGLLYSQEGQNMGRRDGFEFIGHASVKIITKDGVVIYIDPAFKGDYSQPADIILVTHGHSDHNQVDLVTKKDDTKIITHAEALIDGEYKTFGILGVKITAVQAYNARHNINECVGYLLEYDGIKVYHAGDTSKTDQMAELGKIGLDYVFLPIDGVYNMDPAEATECAEILNAKTYFPMHNDPRSSQTGEWYDTGMDDFKVKNKVILEPGNFFMYDFGSY